MSLIRDFFSPLPRIIGRIFFGKNLGLQVIAIALTYICVTSSFDYLYFTWTRQPSLVSFMFGSALLGFFVPVFLPLGLYIYSLIRKDHRLRSVAISVGQAALIGLLVSFFYKALTGRAHPHMGVQTLSDLTRDFQFGILRGGVFWGWPSSHTTVSFSIAAALMTIFRRKNLIWSAALIYALYIGLGVSMTIHWFSDFLAGSIFGIIVGREVARHHLHEVEKS